MINRYGFNSDGADVVAKRLQTLRETLQGQAVQGMVR